MIQLTIDNKEVKVQKGTTVLKAAEKLGIKIPTMCFLDGYSNHPSCMVCLVKNADTGNLEASCALPAKEGMNIISSNNEIITARREALELLLSDHVGDCEAPCRLSCAAFMDIPKMNRLIAAGKFDAALRLVKQDIALPFTLGYICAAPCEKACRRTQLDEAVSICQLKKFVALIDSQQDQNKQMANSNIQNLTTSYLPKKKPLVNKNIAITGTGPAGLATAFYLLNSGYNCVLFDKNEKAGGSLRYEIKEDKLPRKVLDFEIELIKKYGGRFELNKLITKEIFENELKQNFDAIVFSTGDFNKSNLKDFGFKQGKSGIVVNKNTLEVNSDGIFACGNIIRHRKSAINSVAQGKETARTVDMFLRGETPSKKPKMFNSKFGKLFEKELDEYKKETTEDKRIVMELGKLGNFSLEQAIIEAKRCMNCDCRKPISCKLRIYSTEYKADRRKFLFGKRKTIKKYFQHKTIVYEPEKCIRCNLCVDIATKSKETLGLTTINRGFEVEINVPFNKSIENALQKTASKCAKYCPTGAISFKV